MLVMPDIMTLANNGDDAQVRDLQGKMIAHAENAGDRMAILDCAARPAPAGRPRVAHEHGRLRLEDGRALLPVDRGHEPADQAADDDARRRATSPACGAASTTRAACTRRPANEVILGANGLGVPGHPRRAGRPQQGRDQLHPGVPRPRHPDLGRAHAVERSRVALHQRAPAVQLRLRVDHGRHAVERVRAQRRAAVDCGCAIVGRRTSSRRVYRSRRAVRRDAESRRSTSSATPRPTRPRSIEAGQVVCEIGIAPVKPAEFVIFRLSQFTGGGGAEVAE